MRIALDAMGGDYAPKNIVEGAVLALKEYPYIEKLFLVGDAVATGNEYNNPSVALMSIGEEDMRGNDVTKEAFKLLKASGLNFRGNIEGHDLFEKPAEVVICDGFTGNVVLKTTEAVAHAIFSWLKHELFKNPIRRLGAKLAEGAFKAIQAKTNYEEYGGMPLLGVNGVCIIAHGASSPLAVKNAIRAATEFITGYLQ